MTVTGVTSSTISVQWGSVPCIHQNGNITGYLVQYEVDGSGNTQITNVNEAGVTEATLSNLTASTTYSIQVAAVNDAGTGVFNNGQYAMTLGEKLGLRIGSNIPLLLLLHTVSAPVLTADSTTATSISLSWTSGGSEGVSYEVQWQRDTSVGCSYEDQDSQTIADGSTNYIISGLEEGSSYIINMTASNSLGNERSHPITVMTTMTG